MSPRPSLATVVVIGSSRSTRPSLLRAASNAAVKLATSSGSNTGPYSTLRMSRIGTVNPSTARRTQEGSTIPHPQMREKQSSALLEWRASRKAWCGRRSCGTALEFLAGVGPEAEPAGPCPLSRKPDIEPRSPNDRSGTQSGHANGAALTLALGCASGPVACVRLGGRQRRGNRADGEYPLACCRIWPDLKMVRSLWRRECDRIRICACGS